MINNKLCTIPHYYKYINILKQFIVLINKNKYIYILCEFILPNIKI